MENRRKDYRHLFGPGERIAVQLEAPGSRTSVTGEIVNLSLGGMRVRLDAPAGPFAVNDRLLARLTVPGPLSLTSTVVHGHSEENGRYLGLRFVPSANTAADDARAKTLWVFLLDQQRRALKRLRAVEEG